VRKTYIYIERERERDFASKLIMCITKCQSWWVGRKFSRKNRKEKMAWRRHDIQHDDNGLNGETHNVMLSIAFLL
jgi:hypothetical protein